MAKAISQVVVASQPPPRPRRTIWEQKEMMSQCWSIEDPLPLPLSHQGLPTIIWKDSRFFKVEKEEWRYRIEIYCLTLHGILLHTLDWVTQSINTASSPLLLEHIASLGAPHWAFNLKCGVQTESPVTSTHGSQKFHDGKRLANRVQYTPPNIFPQLSIQ